MLIGAAQGRGSPLNLGGDGRSDIPGHSAKFGSYSMMDLETNQIIDVLFVQVTVIGT